MQEETKEIKRKAFTGAMWKFAERISAQLVSIVVAIYLARLLLPDDYGVVAMVSIFFVFCNVIIDSGLNTALIQKNEVDAYDYATVLTASMVLAVFLYILLFYFSPLIASSFNKPILCPLFRVMGITFFINGYKSVVCSYVSRNLLFKKFFYATFSGTVFSGLIGIGAALAGWGPWALALQQIFNALIGTIVLVIVTRYKTVLFFSWHKFKPLFSYGWKIFGSSLLSATYGQIRPLIVGVKYSSSDLAYYTHGQQYPTIIDSSISSTLSAVLFPVISKFQNDKSAVLNITRRYMSLSSYIIMPLLIGFFATADTFVSLVLTDKWMPAVPFARVFCICYLFNIITEGNIQAIKAIGRSDIFLKLEFTKKSFYLLIILFFVLFTDSPLLLAISEILCTLVATIVNIFPNKRLINYGYRAQLMDLLPNLLCAIVMGIVVYYVGKINIDVGLLFPIQIIIGIIVYLMMCFFTGNNNYTYFKNLVVQTFIKRNNVKNY